MNTKIRVLHIDDSKHDRQLVKDALTKENDKFDIIEADNREKFELHISKKDFDIILSDFNILGFDGLQVLQIVEEKLRDVPVIIVTGTGSEEIAIQAMKMGASDYVIKSVNHIRGLVHTIDAVLENKKIRKERIAAQIALRKSEEKYRKIFENVQDVFYQIDMDGVITEISPSVYRLINYLPEELLGNAMSCFYYNIDEGKTLMEKIILNDEVWDYEIRLKTKSGELKYASLNAHVMFNEENQHIGVEGAFRDVSERKHMESELLKAKEKAEESDRLKTAFLHNISHEIRTPANAIIGFSGLLNDVGLLPEKRQYFTDIIIQSSYQLLSIISDIVNIATIQAGQDTITETKIELHSTLQQLHKQFLNKAKKQNISLNLATSSSENKLYFLSDEIKINQILTNLIGNAIKFTKRGDINFGYVIKESQPGESQLEFFVQDSGIGIASNMHEEIFKRFRQVESNTAPHLRGSGLGLSLSKAYVELMGGKIWLNSVLDHGSTFYFTIPYKKVKNDAFTGEQSSDDLNIDNEITKTLLIAEDEESNFMLLEELLSELNVSIVRAENGMEAVEICKLKQQEIDLVLMDIKMPIMDGYEATRIIKEFKPNLPVIALTAYTTDADKAKAFACGCNDFIGKPIKWELLIATINEHLYNSNQCL